MVSRKEDTIDFHKLEDQVNDAMEADARYYRENDAKFRAIHQKVTSYEEFRDIVLASHLKPLAKGDRLDNIKFIQPWNQAADKTASTSAKVTSSGGQKKLLKKPANGHEFSRDWRQVCKSKPDKYAFLLWIGPDTLAKIFKMEISFGLLGDMITALNEQYQPEHSREVVAILKSLSSANRFKLSMDFLSSAEKDTCQKLFDKLSEDLNIVNRSECEEIVHSESESQSHDQENQSETESVTETDEKPTTETNQKSVNETIFSVHELAALKELYGLET